MYQKLWIMFQVGVKWHEKKKKGMNLGF